MLRTMPFILLVLIAVVLCCHAWMPHAMQAFLYAVSLTIKSVILFFLPILIFGLLFKSLVQFAHQATTIVLLIVLGVCCSNFLSTYLSHFVGMWVYQLDTALVLPESTEGLAPLWQFRLPGLIPNNIAMGAGALLGLLLTKTMPDAAQQLSSLLDHIIRKMLAVLTYLVPAFVLGFVVKLQADQVVYSLFENYALIFCVVAVAQFSYILFVYSMANGLVLQRVIASVKNMLPAAITGFSTMSSAASMPLTIMGTEKNVHEKDFAKSIIPATVNIHLVGDCFAIPIFAYAILKNFGVAEPTLVQYLIFTGYFVLAKFSVAAIPGGGIIVMLPILESQLGFNAEMLSLITALYILFDPVITCANVLGNGGFAMVMSKLVARLRRPLAMSTR